MGSFKSYKIMNNNLLKLEKITKNFGNVEVLKEVSLTIDKGEVVALVGDNGAGKSTLIKVITGIHKPNSGKIFFKNSEVKIKSVSQSRKMGIETVYQERALCDQQELYRNLFAGREITNALGFLNIKQQRKESEKILRNYIGFTSKAITVDSPVLGLSGGEKQRVAIARTILKNPKIFFFDEATSALDSSTEKEIQKNLESVSKDKTTLIIAHRLSTAANADNIIVLDKGIIIEQGTHKSLLLEKGKYFEMWGKQKLS